MGIFSPNIPRCHAAVIAGEVASLDTSRPRCSRTGLCPRVSKRNINEPANWKREFINLNFLRIFREKKTKKRNEFSFFCFDKLTANKNKVNRSRSLWRCSLNPRNIIVNVSPYLRFSRKKNIFKTNYSGKKENKNNGENNDIH